MDWLLPVVTFVSGVLLSGVVVFLIQRSQKLLLAARVQQQEADIFKLDEACEEARRRLEASIQEISELRTQVTTLETKLESEQEHFTEKEQVYKELEKRFSDVFKALSGEALKENNRSFLELAKEHLNSQQVKSKGELEKRKQAIEALLKPINDSLKNFGEKVGDIEKARVGTYEALKEQVLSLAEGQTRLRTETGNLARALNTPRVRGSWGEIQLKKVVELAGMLEHCDFEEQQSKDRDDGSRARPDMIVHLPGDKQIIIDAKAPLEGFLAALEANEKKDKEARMTDHTRHIRMHIKELGGKSYWEQFENTPEFVVLFLPGESFFSAALEVEPGLIDEGVQQKVILATPTTLIALLKVVSYGWRQENLAQQSREISKLGKEIYDRVSDVAKNWMSVGKGLRNAVESYNKAVSNLESRVLVSARKMKELPIDLSKKEIDGSMLVDAVPRELQAAELKDEESE
ncbi:MAG: DNA recombination protein RmuC [Opitutales bacterium]|nr:DNA recombination protein RmuC [Opitutales bacterium]